MILNACVRDNKMVDENICKFCTDKNCRHAGKPTTAERLDGNLYGNREATMQKLQAEYNALHDKMGYARNPETIAAINKELDRISAEMTAIIEGGA
jgi:hypothetical protein